MHSTNSSNLGLSSYSSAMKKDILWNVVEPGDPYDIRKYFFLLQRSMIAKLPGSRKNFMGSHLEIVCLLQSAEIERLCEFLDDYKYRYYLKFKIDIEKLNVENLIGILMKSKSNNSPSNFKMKHLFNQKTPN